MKSVIILYYGVNTPSVLSSTKQFEELIASSKAAVHSDYRVMHEDDKQIILMFWGYAKHNCDITKTAHATFPPYELRHSTEDVTNEKG